jgi:hypothetical protein
MDALKSLKVPPGFQGRRGDSQQPSGDSIISPVANPWMSYEMRTLLNTLKPGVVQGQRTIAIAGCSYSQVIQCRDWLPDEIGGIAWFSFDNPACSPRIPVYAGVLSLPDSWEVCGQKRYREDSGCWQFRRANRLAEIRWGRTRTIIDQGVKEFEDKAFIEIPMMDKKALEMYNAAKGKEPGKDERGNPKPAAHRVFLTNYTNDFARAAMVKWWEMGDQFFTMFARGF